MQRYTFRFTHYRTNGVLKFVGTDQEFQDMMDEVGGCFTLVSKEPA